MAINILDQNTINQIAAGEVVERPSSVVKELVENSIDAGATAITVEIKDGGTTLIRITDNGCGIDKSEVKIAFLRHSTSKIKDAADLVAISSLGFRGEALSSISAVAQVELITKTPEALCGIRYMIDGGNEKSFEEVGVPDGTTIVVRNLFFNTPARRKFLKTPNSEASYVSTIVEHLCLSHPEIAFKYIVNNSTKIQTSGNGRLRDVIYTLYGREVTANIIEIGAEYENFAVKGYIGKPVTSRGSRAFENYFINGRYIKNKLITSAIEDAYSNFIMQHKYPFVALYIDIDAAFLDVNVHPSKMELRLSNGPYIYDCLCECIHKALSSKELIHDFVPDYEPDIPQSNTKIDKTEPPIIKEAQAIPYDIEPKVTKPIYDPKPVIPNKVKMPEPFEVKRTQEVAPQIKEELKAPVQLELFDRKEILKEENVPDIKIVGQIFETYWIIEFEKNMYIVDQHAAHEKVLFEKFMKQYEDRTITTQYISPPIIISTTQQETQILLDNANYFAEMGFELEEFGSGEFSLSGIPAQFSAALPEDIIRTILDDFVNDNRKPTSDIIKDKIATMACKAAVKGNNKLSYAEADSLLKQLMKLENPYNCPHGRPTMITMSKYEIEKKFGRIV